MHLFKNAFSCTLISIPCKPWIAGEDDIHTGIGDV